MATRSTQTVTLALVPVANTATLRATQTVALAAVPQFNNSTVRATQTVALALVPVSAVKRRAKSFIIG